jgi:hypothetical protein
VLIVNRKDTIKRNVGLKEVDQRVKDQSNFKRKIPRRKKVKRRCI